MIRSWWLRIVAFLLIVALLTYGIRVRSELIKKVASCFVYPVLLMQHVIVDPIKQHQDNVAHVETLQEQLNALRMQHEQTLAENVQLRATLSYMNDIKELQEYKKRYQEDAGQVAQVLVRHFSDQEHYFYIDAGSSKNIQKDMVVAYKNNLIGKITEVYPWYSKVTLITDKHCKVAAYCAKTKAHGIHQGINSEAKTTLSYVNHLETVQEGDLVLSSGQGLIFPRGFALGSIQASHTEDLYKQVTLEPACDLRRLDYCMIIAKN